MIVEERLVLSTDRPVLDQLLESWNMTYFDFAKQLDIDHRSLWRYRKGERKLRLDTSQIKTLICLLSQVGLRFEDLPDDWILEP